jgi:hypothetical protein
MPRAVSAVLCFLAATPCLAASGDFPSSATYLFFVSGKPSGRIDVTTAAEDGRYVFTSKFEVLTGEETHSLSSRTEVDKKTLRPLLFQYEGERNGHPMSGKLDLEPDSIRAVQDIAGRLTRKRVPWADGTMVFQNYVTEHLMVLARHVSESGKAFEHFVILFPTEMITTPALATIESEVELAARQAPVVCKKYMVSIQNSYPFYLYVESKSNALIYLEFPVSGTEVFLKSAFGDHPEPRYKEPPKTENEE